MFRTLLTWCSVELPQLAAFFLGAALLLGLISPSGAQTYCEKWAAQSDKVPPSGSGCGQTKETKIIQLYDKEGRPLNDREGRPLREGKAVCQLEEVQYSCPNPAGDGKRYLWYQKYSPVPADASGDTYSITTDKPPESPDPSPPPDYAPPPSLPPFRLEATYERKDPARTPSEYDHYEPRALEPNRTAQQRAKLKSGVQANKQSSTNETWVGKPTVVVDNDKKKKKSVVLDLEIRSEVDKDKYVEFPITLKEKNRVVNRLGGMRTAKDQFLISKVYLVGGKSIPCEGDCSVRLKKQ